jgi:hypothetical protein
LRKLWKNNLLFIYLEKNVGPCLILEKENEKARIKVSVKKKLKKVQIAINFSSVFFYQAKNLNKKKIVCVISHDDQ